MSVRHYLQMIGNSLLNLVVMIWLVLHFVREAWCNKRLTTRHAD